MRSYFDFIFVHLRQKNTSWARIKPEIFVKFRPKPDPKARLDLQLWLLQLVIVYEKTKIF